MVTNAALAVMARLAQDLCRAQGACTCCRVCANMFGGAVITQVDVDRLGRTFWAVYVCVAARYLRFLHGWWPRIRRTIETGLARFTFRYMFCANSISISSFGT